MIFVDSRLLLFLTLVTFLISPVACKERSRKILREPLAAPLTVAGIQGSTLVLESGEAVKLIGVHVPRPGLYDEVVEEFLSLLTRNGLEIVRKGPDGKCWTRCEVRVQHRCATDPVIAHHEQHSINELIISCGYGEFVDDSDLTEDERLRLMAAEFFVLYGSVAGLADGLSCPMPPLRFDLETGIAAGPFVFMTESVEEMLLALRIVARAGGTLPLK